jgi:alpha-L-fucosidase
MARYREFGAEIRRRFGRSLAETSGRGGTVTLKLEGATTIDHAILMEDIRAGERVREYVIEGRTDRGWIELARGESIGHKRIERFDPVTVSAVRLRTLRSAARPIIRKLAVYRVD